MKKTRLEKPGPARFLLPAFVLASVLLLASQAPQLYKRLTCPVQVQQEEAVNVEFARILLRGDSLYPDITKAGPYIHPSYPPLFPWLQSQAMKFIPGIWAPGRTLAFLGYLGCGFLLAYTAWRRWKNPYWVVLMPSLLWLSPTWEMWGTMVRLDSCLHFLNMASFLVLWKAVEPFHPEWKQRTEGPIALAGLLNAAAILMKPTALTVTLAFALYAALRRLKRESVLFFSCALVPVAVFLAAAQIETHGMYWKHTVTWAAVGFHLEQLLHFLGKGFLPEAGWIIVGVGLTFWVKRFSLLLKCQLLLSTLSLWTLSREGAAENYFMEFLWVGLLVIGEGWAGCKLVKTVPRFTKGSWAQRLALVPFLILMSGVLSFVRYREPRVPNRAEIQAKYEASRPYTSKDILTGTRFLALDADLLVMTGWPVWYQHSGILAIEKAGKWDPAPLLADIAAKKFSTIELYDLPRQYLVSEKVEEVIRANYKVSLRQYGRVWLTPKTP